MFKNYLKTAIRNLVRYKGFSIINITGLTAGIAGCILIGLFILDEHSFDRFIPGNENIYRIYNIRYAQDEEGAKFGTVPPTFGVVARDFPDVSSSLRMLHSMDADLLESGNVKAYEGDAIWAENTFLSFFPLDLKYGNAEKAMEGPHKVVLTEKIADKYFPRTNPVGKTLVINKENFTVTAVLKKVPDNFHLKFDYLISLGTLNLPKERMESWNWQQFYTYIKLKAGTDAAAFEKKFRDHVIALAHPITKPVGFYYIPYLQPLPELHLNSADFRHDELPVKGNIIYVNALTYIAIFVLAIACFNFINLATARAGRRAREIGVRKVMGADRKALIIQFLSETVLLSLFSVILAALAAKLLLGPLNQFTGKAITFHPFTELMPALAILGGGIMVGLLAGVYPAFYLSGFQPAKVIKGTMPASFGSGKSWLRESLVVVQFSLSALLIICTIVVFRQTGYLHNKDLGFRKDQVVLFRLRGNISDKLDALKQELKKDPHIISATAGYGFPGDMLAGDEIIVPGKGTFGAKQLMVDHDYASTLGIRFIAGRDFSRDMKTDPDEAFVINESAVRELGFGTPEKAVGQPLQWTKWYGEGDSIKRGKVIGVIKDFHYSSLHEKISTTVLQLFPEHYQMAVKISGDDVKSTLNYMQSTWSAFNQEYPFEYKFLDENFDRMYKAEDRLSTLLLIFTVMAIFVGCLGLFGLASFSAEKRAKEISIRKILGAGITDIVSLLSRRFIALIVVASVVAFPIAWWAMHAWLQHFPYRLSMNAGIFAFALALSLLIAFAAISFQSVKAAIANPVDKLRNE